MHISVKCSIAVHCLIFIHEYGKDIRVTSKLLSLSTGCNSVIIRNILSALKKANILLIKKGTGGATLNLNPTEINLYRIYHAVEPDFLDKFIGIHETPSPFCPVGKNIHSVLDSFYGKVREDLERSLKAITLEAIVEDYHNKLN